MDGFSLAGLASVVVVVALAFAYYRRPWASRRQEAWYAVQLSLASIACLMAAFDDIAIGLARVAVLVAATVALWYETWIRSDDQMTPDRALSARAACAVMLAATVTQSLLPVSTAPLSFVMASLVLAYDSLPDSDIYVDPKTGALKREGMQEIIAWRLRSKGKVSILAVAVRRYEDLRMVNGEERMSEALREVACSLMELPCHIYVSYLGRGRFIVVGDERFDVCEAASQVEGRFRHPWLAGSAAISLEEDLAVLLPDNTIPTAFEVLRTMDVAMDESVLGGQEGPLVVDDHVLFVFDEHSHVRRVLERAMEENRVEVWFQALYDVDKGCVTGAEALARLRDEDGSLISPEIFIAVAEKAGIIERLGDQIFDKVCSFVASCDLRSLGISFITVNLSPLQCLSDELPRRLRAISREHGVCMDFFHLEITESAMVDVSVLAEQMSLLVGAGSKFSLDDYGTGYSNLTRMVSLPFENVKLDYSIVWDHFEGRSSFLPILVSAFHNQGFEVTAEGVETEEMAVGLKGMGVDILQGFYFSKALPPADFISYVRDFEVPDALIDRTRWEQGALVS